MCNRCLYDVFSPCGGEAQHRAWPPLPVDVQLVPELLPRDALPPPSPAPASPAPLLGPPSPPPGGRHSPPPAASPEAAAAVLAALAGAKAAVADSLGREVLAMLQRRILLGDASAEAKLGQLSAALTLFIESEGA